MSANTQGTYLNQVYIGMFRPDGNALPRWVGNLKQYQFIYNQQADSLQLADASGVAAVSPTTGFIDEDATSFWTKPSSFWINLETASGGKVSRSDAPDGEKVEKGGVAQLLRERYFSSAATRPFFTCPGLTCGNDVDLTAVGNSYRFSTANSALSPWLFGLASTDTTGRDLLINWVRGEDNVATGNVGNESLARDQLAQRPTGALVRPSIHGDVLHSRPIAINYGGSRGVVVYYGANDGVLRAVNGNQTGSGAGSEMWGFVAPEHFDNLRRQRENDPEVRYPSTPSANTTARLREYFFDGPIGAYQNTYTNEVMLFAGMRRGGRSIYALNVSNPDQPRLMWRINESFTGYGSIGQTWSMPRVSRVKGRTRPGADHGRRLRPDRRRRHAGRDADHRPRRLHHEHPYRPAARLAADRLQRAGRRDRDRLGRRRLRRPRLCRRRAGAALPDRHRGRRRQFARPVRVGHHQDRRAERQPDRADRIAQGLLRAGRGDHAQLHRASLWHRRSRETAADDDERSLLRDQGPARSRRASRPRCR